MKQNSHREELIQVISWYRDLLIENAELSNRLFETTAAAEALADIIGEFGDDVIKKEARKAIKSILFGTIKDEL